MTNEMPTRLWINRYLEGQPEPHEGASVEYIRANEVAQMLAAKNARIAELEATLQTAIHQAIQRERAYQDRKYGDPQTRRLLLAEYLHIAQQELNEAMCSMADRDEENALREALQVAAVIVAMLERFGVVERDYVPETQLS